MDISKPPLIRAALIEMGSAIPQELILIVHHLISDNVSHAVLHEDFEAAYTSIVSGSELQLGAKTLSFKDWSNLLLSHYRSVDGESELSYWNDLPWNIAAIPTDYEGEDTYGAIQSLALQLSTTETEVLLHLQKRRGLQMEEILLTALAEALASWTKRSQFLICRTTHGRSFKDADVSRTIGWFTSIVPTLLEAPAHLEKSTAFERVRKAIRQVPNNGLGFGVLKYMCGKSLPPLPLVYFDYQGKQGIRAERGLLSPISRRPHVGQERYGRAKRAWHLEFGAVISGGSLSITARYGGELYRKSTIEILLNEMFISLGRLTTS
jgi:non-ribosomal peptide synthase protein (TIGR01720 family)